MIRRSHLDQIVLDVEFVLAVVQGAGRPGEELTLEISSR
jgi:hypothetical protein